jgi:hypothetical protein
MNYAFQIFAVTGRAAEPSAAAPNFESKGGFALPTPGPGRFFLGAR